MKVFIRSIFLIMVTFSSQSCIDLKKDFEVELPPVPNEFAVTAYINIGLDTIPYFQIERLKRKGAQSIPTIADLTIYKDESIIYEHKNYTSNLLLTDLNLASFEPGHWYTIEVKDPAGILKTCTAKSYLFNRPEVGNFSYKHALTYNPFTDNSDEAIIGIKDEPGIKNVYYVGANIIINYQQYEYDDDWNVIDSIPFPVLSSTYPADFDGENDLQGNSHVSDSRISQDGYIYAKRLPDTFIGRRADSATIEYIVCSVSEDEARFSESIRLARDIEDNQFGEPVSTFTNFQNGNGIFSVRNCIEGKKTVKAKN